jgi:hypothetical protein
MEELQRGAVKRGSWLPVRVHSSQQLDLVSISTLDV